MPLAEHLLVTEIDAEFKGDAYAPVIGEQWRLVRREFHSAKSGLAYSFARYVRRPEFKTGEQLVQ